MSRSRKPSAASIDALIADLMPASRRENPLFAAQASGLFRCNDADHVTNDRGGMSPAGFVAHAFGRKATTCNAVDVLKALLRDGILLPDEVIAARQTGKSPDVAEVLRRAAKVA